MVALRHRDLSSEDVFVGEYPRSGATWVSFILGEIAFDQPIDFGSATRLTPFVRNHGDALRSPRLGGRLIRTHERYRDRYKRAVYVVRHVADVAVSRYNHLPWIGIAKPEFSVFLENMLAGKVDGYSTWPQHIASWLDAPNGAVHLVKYEDMHDDADATISGALEFFGVEADPAQVHAAIAANTLDRMKEKERRAPTWTFGKPLPEVPFVRQGEVGGWRQTLEAADIELIERVAGPTLRRLGYGTVPAMSSSTYS